MKFHSLFPEKQSLEVTSGDHLLNPQSRVNESKLSGPCPTEFWISQFDACCILYSPVLRRRTTNKHDKGTQNSFSSRMYSPNSLHLSSHSKCSSPLAFIHVFYSGKLRLWPWTPGVPRGHAGGYESLPLTFSWCTPILLLSLL